MKVQDKVEQLFQVYASSRRKGYTNAILTASRNSNGGLYVVMADKKESTSATKITPYVTTIDDLVTNKFKGLDCGYLLDNHVLGELFAEIGDEFDSLATDCGCLEFQHNKLKEELKLEESRTWWNKLWGSYPKSR